MNIDQCEQIAATGQSNFFITVFDHSVFTVIFAKKMPCEFDFYIGDVRTQIIERVPERDTVTNRALLNHNGWEHLTYDVATATEINERRDEILYKDIDKKYAYALRALEAISPWLSASLNDSCCDEYKAACNLCFDADILTKAKNLG